MTAYFPADAAYVATLQRYARVAGVAMLLSVVFGFLGEAYLPSRIVVQGDAAATAANILAHPTLFRLTFASYLVEGICDITLAVLFYILLKPVNRNVALLSAFFGIVAVTFAVAQSSFYASSLILRETADMAVFATEQREALALLAIRIGSMIAALFLCTYGIATMIRGYLIARSGYLPRVIGILFFIGGAGFFVRSITYIVAPSFSSPYFLLPMALGGLSLMGWLLLRGLDGRRIRAADGSA